MDDSDWLSDSYGDSFGDSFGDVELDSDLGGGDGAPMRRPAALTRRGVGGSCRAFADGTMQGASGICWLWFVLMVLAFIGNAAWAVQRAVTAKKAQRTQCFLVTLASLVVGALNICIFFHFLNRCECWTGLFATLAISMVAGALIYVLAPDCAAEEAEAQMFPSDEDWAQIKAAVKQQQQKPRSQA